MQKAMIATLEKCLFPLVDINCAGTGPIDIRKLHSISLKSLDEVADQDKDNYANVLRSLVSLAGARIVSDLANRLDTKRINHHNGSGCIGVPASDNATLIYTGKQGVRFQLNRSKYLVMRIRSIVVFSEIDQNITLKIEDQYSTLWTQTYALTAGANELAINFEISNALYKRDLFVGYDQTLHAYKVMALYCDDDCTSYWQGTCGQCSSAGNAFVGGDTGGITVHYDLTCSLEAFLCYNVDRLSTALLYAMGIEHILTALGTTRRNVNTVVQGAMNQVNLLPAYEMRFKEEMEAFYRSTDFCDNCCFECTPAVVNRYVCP